MSTIGKCPKLAVSVAAQDLSIVLDVGKTLTKLSVWDAEGAMRARETRPNNRVDGGSYTALDAAGIEAWLRSTLKSFSALGRIRRIIPVGHGAACALLRDGRLAAPPIDYEEAAPDDIAIAYASDRDAFAETGSPRLPLGLNLGLQLEWLNRLRPDLFGSGTTIVTWAQYWAWVLSGVAATETTTLGCHTDLWRPWEMRPSDLAIRRGWSGLFAPLTEAGSILGTLRPALAEETGLSPDTVVHCGLHDSNAALLAARGFREIAENDSTVLSTGTWFVAMRTPIGNDTGAGFSEDRDCLVNVDAFGKPIPSARFMGGREIEILSGIDARRIDIKPDQPMLLAATPELVRSGVRVLPTFAPGVGPFPNSNGRWIAAPGDAAARRAAVCLYAALVADTSLGLIGARDRILIEGRFAEAEVFVRALASLRPDARIYVSNAQHDVSYGALRLIDPGLSPQSRLERVLPLECDIGAYARQWRADVAGMALQS